MTPVYRPYLTWEACQARYPRLLRAMQWVAILSSGEAACGLRDYVNHRNGHYSHPVLGGEAVAHFGRPERVVRRAVECRHLARRAYGSLRKEGAR